MSEPEERIQKLALCLKHKFTLIRSGAVLGLMECGEPAVPFIIEALHDEAPAVRANAAYALGEIGVPAIHALVGQLGNENPQIRRRAAWVLVVIAEKHPEYEWGTAIPPLIRLLDDGEVSVKANAAVALGMIAGKHPAYGLGRVVPHLIGLLEDGDMLPGRIFSGALAKIGPRDYGDLDSIVSIGGKLKKEGEDFSHIMELHSKWVGIMNQRASAIINDRRFHVPKVRKPDKTERIMRVRRLSA